MLKNKEDVIKLIQRDKEMMKVINTASKLDLSDWWVCAGFVRSKIWDTLHQFQERSVIPDVDVIFFNPTNLNEEYEKELEHKLISIMPNIPWSVKNEARMHIVNNLPPYTSSEDAISKFPETATALGIKVDSKNNLVLTSPCGIEDAINLELKPTAFFTKTKELAAFYEERLQKKNWKATWHKLKVHHLDNH